MRIPTASARNNIKPFEGSAHECPRYGGEALLVPQREIIDALFEFLTANRAIPNRIRA